LSETHCIYKLFGTLEITIIKHILVLRCNL